MAKKRKIKTFSFQGFDNKHYRLTEQYTAAVDALFSRATKEITNVASKENYNPEKPFSFDDYPKTKKHAQKIINGLAGNITAVIANGSRKQWLYACQKNDEFVASIMDTSKLTKARLNKMQDRNLDALQTFQQRKINGMDLSQRVWKYVGQYKDQLELGLDVGLGEGRSAQQLSKDVRQNLQDPDRLFRRVRDKRGNLVLSKAAKAFHPGQGVYRSSYKNAMRLTRSEVNMAYREADWLRWQQLDFVVGFEIHRSNHDPVYKCKLCERLVGRYPKWFKFKGWHPQCRCYMTAVLMDEETFDSQELSDLKSALYGKEYKKLVPKNTVTDFPQGFKDWVVENAEKQAGWGSTPYFIRDNFVNGNLADGLKYIAPTKPIKPVKTEEQKAEIQARWDERAKKNAYNALIKKTANNVLDIANEYPEIDSSLLKKYVESGDLSNMQAETKALAKAISQAKKLESEMDKVIPGFKAWKANFGLEKVQTVYDAVKTKLAAWENLSLEQQLKKVDFELDWVLKNKKYDTWEVAYEAYKEHRKAIEYLINKQGVETSISQALDFAKTTKSAKVKQMAVELTDLLNKETPIATLQAKAQALNAEVAKLEATKAARQAKKFAGEFDFDESNYTKARKDAAMWAKTAEDADKKVRGILESIWKNAAIEEKEAAFYYTSGSSYVNEPLRGLTYSGYKGRDSQKDIDNLTKMINKSSYDFDMWVQRGVGYINVEKTFGINLRLSDITPAKKFLLGKVGIEPAFASCGNTKGSGFSSSEVIYNIYCPKGTKMLYCEPFSAYAGGNKGTNKNGLNWDGKAQAKKIGYEAEMLLQRGTKFRVTKVEYSHGRWYIDLEVIGQL